jgi:tRNA modification GTPase
LRETEDLVEGMGVARAVERAGRADLRVFLCDEAGLPEGLAPEPDDLVVRGKADVAPGSGLAVSGKTGQGVPELVAEITARLGARAAGAGTITRERHRLAVLRAIGAMESARVEVMQGPDRAELAAEEMRRAIRALDSLVGRVDVEHLLGEIFASFCIGK